MQQAQPFGAAAGYGMPPQAGVGFAGGGGGGYAGAMPAPSFAQQQAAQQQPARGAAPDPFFGV